MFETKNTDGRKIQKLLTGATVKECMTDTEPFPYDLFGKYAWLLLRRMSTMTEEEAMEYVEYWNSISKSGHDYIFNKSSRFENDFVSIDVVDHNGEPFSFLLCDDGYMCASSEMDDGPCGYFNIASIGWLIEKGFDPCGLIEAGYAKEMWP